MARIPIQIGALTFDKQADASEYFKEMLHRWEIGAQIPEPDSTHLAWLLERHPELSDKIGKGIKNFSTRNALYGTRCFEIIRTDSTTTDFSYISCIKGKRPSDLSEAVRALRAEIADDILQKKRDYFSENADSDGLIQCVLTGDKIAIGDAHADHAPPRTFGTLAVTFLEARDIDPTSDFVSPPTDNQYQPKIADRQLAEIWRAYHHKLAVIRIVKKSANLSNAHEGKVKVKDKQLQMR